MSYSVAKKDENTEKCEILAEEDNRSVSNFIETLVNREWKRVKGDNIAIPHKV